uniref:Cytochrome c6 n=2 Tax=Gracilariopsis TaxID=2781 RepID=A0A1C9CF44_9FLOR|nr:cytochrome c553 [Gracilariopsis lemaneiformis]YP_009294714.1 cytochrome c553 [Gracilariopsis chorda]AJO68360.1 cytochrome c553 [Gracilariopsis lemaneiformis]AML79838.1 cytochrome c553 [Gracilariopsis lemaneiformis]AOM66974.1 cytochrome c553 [Gracilariopsis chorda]
MRLLFILFIICNIFTNNVHPTTAADLDAGEQIFSANCSACHANGNNAIMPDRTLKKEALEEYDMNSISAITNQVKNGKNAMPAFGGRLADEDIENVANYVLSKSENGW